MDTWTPARVLFKPELEILQLMEDYQKRSFSGLSFNRKIKSALNKNAIKAAWEVERYLEKIYISKG